MIPHDADTLVAPAAEGQQTPGRWSEALPTDVIRQSAARLHRIAILYAFMFFMADFFPALVTSEGRGFLFEHVVYWLPGVLSILTALVVAFIAQSQTFPARSLPMLATIFEIVSSYGIASAEFLLPQRFDGISTWIGLSWVSVWVMVFTFVVPTSARRTLIETLAAVSSVPVMVAVSLRLYPLPFSITITQFFFGFVFPYLLVAIMAYVGAQVVYTLGTEVRKARELGSYRLISRLGEGGMGEVWAAKHRMLARPAAIKLIRPTLAEGAGPEAAEDARRRFEREAQTIASLRSPHTVHLFDFGVAGDGSFYYVMELLDGFDTDRLVQKFGPLPAERVIYVIRQACHSLIEAEAAGLVHRDIKPGNIFLCRYGEDYDFVKVLDFGIVKGTREQGQELPVMLESTVDHVVQGTPAFIAPEQAMGGTVDARADIYAIGCVAYWLLTGQFVFTADTPMRLLVHHAHTVPQPPSTRTELPIPPALDALILRCLAKDPNDRPRSARELAHELSHIEVESIWTEENAREWWTLHKPPEGALPA